jgi:transposase-like protein
VGRQRRTFSINDKLRIIREAEADGIMSTLKKYNLSHSVLLRWRHKFKNGMQSPQENYSFYIAELNSLAEENTRLKKIVADQALELQIKKELLNKLGSKIGNS